jgi:hypothetical protein
VQRDAKEVLAEVLEKLRGKLNAPAELPSAKDNRKGNTVGPNRDRLTVGVDLGDRWSQYCILVPWPPLVGALRFPTFAGVGSEEAR